MKSANMSGHDDSDGVALDGDDLDECMMSHALDVALGHDDLAAAKESCLEAAGLYGFEASEEARWQSALAEARRQVRVMRAAGAP